MKVTDFHIVIDEDAVEADAGIGADIVTLSSSTRSYSLRIFSFNEILLYWAM